MVVQPSIHIAKRYDTPLGPHRSYRTLPVGKPGELVLSGVLLLAIEVGILVFAFPVASFIARLGDAVLANSGFNATLGDGAFLWSVVHPLSFAMPPTGYLSLLYWLAFSVIGVVALTRLRWPAAHLRYVIVMNLLLVASSAVYILLAGHAGYEPVAFSGLYLRTAMTVWIMLPVFVGTISFLFPFTPAERALLAAVAVLYDVALSAVRYAVFMWLLAACGPVIMANLYLFFGTLLDFIVLVGIFAMFMVRLARRLGNTTGAWSWL